MQREHVIKFLEHARERQETYGCQDAFRFAIFIKKQKEYPSLYIGDRPPLRSQKGKKRKTKRTERHQIDPSLLEVDPRMHDNRGQEEVDDHGTPADHLTTTTATSGENGQASDGNRIGDLDRYDQMEPSVCPDGGPITAAAAGIESTSGTTAATCNEASKPSNEKPSRNSKFKKPIVLLNKHGTPKKKSQVGRSDALAIEEAKRLLGTPSKRRR